MQWASRCLLSSVYRVTLLLLPWLHRQPECPGPGRQTLVALKQMLTGIVKELAEVCVMFQCD